MSVMNFEDEPMDVDMSGNSTRNTDSMDISYNDLNYTAEIKIKEETLETDNEDIKENKFDNEFHATAPTVTVIKRFSLQRKDHKSMSNTLLSVTFIILGLASLMMYYIVKFECSKELDLDMLKKSLSRNLIGQPLAIERIIESLEEKSSSKILLLYGGTGVGKTLTASLILENLHHYSNIYHYTMPSFSDTFSADLMLGLTFCPTSMIVIDDLNSTDMYIKEHIEKLIDKSEYLNKNITIILIFNCDTINDHYVKQCDYSFNLVLQEAFKEIKALKRFIKFNSLNEQHLRKCLEKELVGKNVSDEELNSIAKNFNVSVDGCKGVYMKIKLLNIN